MKLKQIKTAFLYTRVSTTDQKDSGYSLAFQEQALREYCSKQGIQVLHHFEEDYSAKNFDRPEFKKLMGIIKSAKPDMLLFYSWDRFSRDTPGSYKYIQMFENMGVKVNAILEPINFADPTQYLLLAVYLALPDIDNKIRSKKTRNGIIAALQEGRYINRAPFGYLNGRDGNGHKPLIRIDEDKAGIVKQIFEEFATGRISQADIIKKFKPLGLRLKRTQLSTMLSNPVYMGKVVVPRYEDHPTQMVNGLHKAIIGEALFYKVQSVKYQLAPVTLKVSSNHSENLPMRGFLRCAKCGSNLTGSASKSRNGSHHYYYHCNRRTGCNENLSAGIVHDKLIEILKGINPSEKVLKLYRLILLDQYNDLTKTRRLQRTTLEAKKKDIEEKMMTLTERFLMHSDKVDEGSYSKLKDRLNAELIDVKLKLEENSGDGKHMEKFVDFGIGMISNMDILYVKASANIKRNLLGSIFTEKLVFSENKYRTANFNPAIAFIANIYMGSAMRKKKNGEPLSRFSASVPGAGLEPARFPNGV